MSSQETTASSYQNIHTIASFRLMDFLSKSQSQRAQSKPGTCSDQQDPVAAFDTLTCHGLSQREGNRGRNAVATQGQVEYQLVATEAETSRELFDGMPAGLVGHDHV